MNRMNTLAMLGVVLSSLTDEQLQEVYEKAAQSAILNVVRTLPDEHVAIDSKPTPRLTRRGKKSKKD